MNERPPSEMSRADKIAARVPDDVEDYLPPDVRFLRACGSTRRHGPHADCDGIPLPPIDEGAQSSEAVPDA